VDYRERFYQRPKAGPPAAEPEPVPGAVARVTAGPLRDPKPRAAEEVQGGCLAAGGAGQQEAAEGRHQEADAAAEEDEDGDDVGPMQQQQGKANLRALLAQWSCDVHITREGGNGNNISSKGSVAVANSSGSNASSADGGAGNAGVAKRAVNGGCGCSAALGVAKGAGCAIAGTNGCAVSTAASLPPRPGPLSVRPSPDGPRDPSDEWDIVQYEFSMPVASLNAVRRDAAFAGLTT
jgi:hypothetical protein